MPVSRLIIGCLTLLTLSACSPQPVANSNSVKTLRVNSQASVEAVPDSINMSLTITELGDDLPQLKANVDASTRSVLDFLTKQNIAEQAISSYRLMVRPRYDYRDGQQIFIGYDVSRQIQIELSSAEAYDPILNFALANGVTQVSAPNYYFSNPEPLYNQALTLALESAREKAERMASTMTVEIVGIQHIVEYSQGVSTKQQYVSADMVTRQREVSLPGQDQVQAQVEVTFIIE